MLVMGQVVIGGKCSRGSSKFCTKAEYGKGTKVDSQEVEANRNKILFLEKVRQSNEAITNGDFQGAIRLYTEAINLDPINHILYSNRSAAFVKMGHFQKGLEDAVKARDLNPKWAKGYYREGVALQCMERPADALAAFASGLAQDPKNSQLLLGLIEAALKSPIKEKFEPTFCQLQKMKLDKSPFVIISLIGQELLAANFPGASMVVLESALKIGTCSLKLRGSVFSALSSSHWALGNIDKAISYMQQDLNIAKSLGDQEGECRAHGNLGSSYFSKGNYREALTNHRFQLVLAMRLKDRRTAASALSNLGHVYTAIGDYPNALASHKQCVLLVKQMNDRLMEAREIGNVGAVYLALGEFENAVECHNEHLRIAKQLDNKYEEARSYSNLGSAYHYKREYDKGIAFHNQVLTIATELTDKTLEARAYAGLGHAARAKGDLGQSKEYHEKQLDNALHTKDKVAEGRACSNLGIIFQSVGEYDAALKLHKAHLNNAKELGDRASQGRAYGNIGNAYYALGKYDLSVKYHKQELSISREVNDRHSEAATHGNLAVAYQALKMYEQALQHYHAHLAISQELKDTVSEARALSNLGNYHSSRGEYSQSIPFYQHFLTLSQELQDTDGEGKACHNLGYAHFNLGNFREAVRYYEQDLAIAKDSQDKNAMGRAYCNLGLAHKALGDFSQALECQNNFLVITHQGKNLTGKFRALGNIGDVLIKMGNAAEAIKMYNQQLKLAKQAGDKNLEASAFCALGSAHRILGECDKALGYHTQELTIRQEMNDVKGECRAHGHLGNVHMSLGSYTNAYKCYEEQLDRARDFQDSAIEAQAYGNLGITKMNMGHFDDAIGLFEQQLAMLEQVSGVSATSDRGRAYGNLGDCYEALGDFEEAVKCHEQFLSIGQSLNNAADQEKAYRGLGNAHRAMGNLQQSLVCFEKRLVVAHELDNPTARGSAYGELGCLHSLLGNFEQAISCLEHQLKIAQEMKDKVGEGDAACGLGGVYQQMGEYDSALTYHKMDLDIAEESNNTACQCRAFGNLGLSHESLGNFEQAIAYQEQHLSLAAQMNDKVAKTLAFSSLGRVHHALGHYPQAVQYLQQGLQIAEQLGRKEDEAKIRHRLGLALWGHEDMEEAQQQLYRAAELFENIRREAQMSSDYKLSLFDLQTASYQALQRVLVALGRHEEALVVAERGRTRAFVDLLLERQTGGEGMYVDNTPMTVEQILHIVSRQKATVVYYSIAAGYLYCWVLSPEKGIVKFYEKNINEADTGSVDEVDADTQSLNMSSTSLLDQYVGGVRESLGIESHLSNSSLRLSTSRSSSMMSENESDADEMWQQQLEEIGGKLNAENDRTGFLRMVNRNHVFNASNYSLSSLFSFSGSINGLNMNRGNSLRKSSRGWSGKPPLSALYDLLIAPIEDSLPPSADDLDSQLSQSSHSSHSSHTHKKEIVLVLQGDLYLVPFAVLKNSQANSYLYEKFNLVAVPSLTALQGNQGSVRLTRLGLEATGSLIVGNPALPISIKEQWQWSELPSAEQEAKIIAEMMGAKPLTSHAATKEAVLHHMPKSEVMHFATHVSWKLSSVVLSPGEFTPEHRTDRFHDDSGSDISSTMDGPSLPEFLLTAADVLNIKLNAKLVVLNSGHTDDRAGRINSDGVVGLTRAFLAAGAQCVVFSLWPVPAEASKIFMRSFYTSMLQGYQASKAISEAMRTVQTTKQYTHPSSWGGWVMVGSDVKLSSKVALMGHAFYEILQHPNKCREAMRVLLHLVEKSLQRIHRGQKNAMYTTQQSIETKVCNIHGWKDLLISIGFRFEPAANGLPPAVFFPTSDPGERLTQCSASLQALLGLPVNSLIPLSKLLSQYEAGEAIIQLLRDVNGKLSQKDGNAQVTMRVKLWRVPGCHEFLAAIGFDLIDVGKDEVTIKPGKQATKRTVQCALQALLAVLDTQEAPRSLSLDSSSSMESLASSGSATSTSNFSKGSTPPDSPHGRGRFPTGAYTMDPSTRMQLMQQGGLVGRNLPGFQRFSPGIGNKPGLGQYRGGPVQKNGLTSPNMSAKVEDAFRYGGPSATSLQQKPQEYQENMPKVLGVEVQHHRDENGSISSSASESGGVHPMLNNSNAAAPLHHEEYESSEEELPYNPPPMTDYTGLNRQSNLRSSAASGSSTLTGKSGSSGGIKRAFDLKSHRSSTKSSASDRTLTNEPQTLSTPKRTDSLSSDKSSELSYPDTKPLGITDPTMLAHKVLAETHQHWQAVEHMQRLSIQELKKEQAANPMPVPPVPDAPQTQATSTPIQQNPQISQQHDDMEMEFHEINVDDSPYHREQTNISQQHRPSARPFAPKRTSSDSSAASSRGSGHPDGSSDNGRSQERRPKPLGVSAPANGQDSVRNLNGPRKITGYTPPGTPPPKYGESTPLSEAHSLKPSRPPPPPKPILKHVHFNDQHHNNSADFEAAPPPLPPPRGVPYDNDADDEIGEGRGQQDRQDSQYGIKYAEKKTVHMTDNEKPAEKFDLNNIPKIFQQNGPLSSGMRPPYLPPYPRHRLPPPYPHGGVSPRGQSPRSPQHGYFQQKPLQSPLNFVQPDSSDSDWEGQDQRSPALRTFASPQTKAPIAQRYTASRGSPSRTSPMASPSSQFSSPQNRPGSATSTSSQYSSASASSAQTVIHRPPSILEGQEESNNSRDSLPSTAGTYTQNSSFERYPSPRGSTSTPPQYNTGKMDYNSWRQHEPQGNERLSNANHMAVSPKNVQSWQGYRQSPNQTPNHTRSEYAEKYELSYIQSTTQRPDYSDTDESVSSQGSRPTMPAFLQGKSNGNVQMYYIDSDRQPVKKTRVLQSSKC
ncbi:tetratricopeptide repeat protein 28 isoform X1 [Lingula anatina]|uniref:Tetratricopeptide repeat protein 28 isoform X1 n=1 Tax=Lingula anatina TaxID=7574 RepID=A0A1S3JCG3_LINAN|nr:tetratricopeptide repeat protein 28 isoform X1 [Lingula anatina]|eukprot:XP_013408018.1 tetratricopeptide repeat protein 28 isoform X1 [Lingula anatina]